MWFKIVPKNYKLEVAHDKLWSKLTLDFSGVVLRCYSDIKLKIREIWGSQGDE
jgi:hypothetical protein